MPDRKHVESIEGGPKPADIFQPYLQGVELFEDMDLVFQEARQLGAGQHPTTGDPDQAKRGVAVVTPGRLIVLDPCPERNSVPESELLPMLAMLPAKSPLNISVVSHTRIEALHEDMNKAIPFRGYLLAWATAGHNVIVFEGHPSAFDSGVRDADVLLMDSGMLPFVQFNWVEAALRVMRPEGKIFLHDRKTFTLSIISKSDDSSQESDVDVNYGALLLRGLMRATQSSVAVTAGEIVPDLVDLMSTSIDRDWISKNIERDKVNAGKVIDMLLHKAGWRWYTPFKTSGVLKLPVPLADGRVGNWNFTLTLTKNAAGKKQLRIDR